MRIASLLYKQDFSNSQATEWWGSHKDLLPILGPQVNPSRGIAHWSMSQGQYYFTCGDLKGCELNH